MVFPDYKFASHIFTRRKPMQTKLNERKARFMRYWEPRRQKKRRFLLINTIPYSLLVTFIPLLWIGEPFEWVKILLEWAVTFLLLLASGHWVWRHNEKTYRNYLEES